MLIGLVLGAVFTSLNCPRKQLAEASYTMKTTILVILLMSGALFYACNNGPKTPSETETADSAKEEMADAKTDNPLKPKGPKPDWAPQIHDEMTVVMEKLASLGGKPIETLTAQEARQQPTPTDAVMAVMAEHSIPLPPPGCDTMGKEVAPGVHARIYTPKNARQNLPVIVYYHGGGWVIATIDVYNASAQALCEQTGAVVVSIEYRKGPENKFPAAHMDAFAAYQWVLANAGSLKGDPTKIAVVGESAGGNLACNVSIMARDKKIQMPVYQVLVYPVAQADMNTTSYQKNATAKPLNRAMMEWFTKNYLPSMATAQDPRISLVKANLNGLPATTIITAEIDPLLDDGRMLADKLKEAGVSVNLKNYEGVTHEFFGMAALVPEAKDAQALAAGDLKKAFGR